jgi:hypothetical protein
MASAGTGAKRRGKAAKQKPVSTYTGKLAEPLVVPLLTPPDDLETRWQRHMLGLLPDLFEHHRVPFGNFGRLALQLAIAHVPGFQVTVSPPPKAGRPAKLDTFPRAAYLVKVVHMRKRKLGGSISQACSSIAKDKKLAAALGLGTAATIHREYYKAKKWLEASPAFAIHRRRGGSEQGFLEMFEAMELEPVT